MWETSWENLGNILGKLGADVGNNLGKLGADVGNNLGKLGADVGNTPGRDLDDWADLLGFWRVSLRSRHT